MQSKSKTSEPSLLSSPPTRTTTFSLIISFSFDCLRFCLVFIWFSPFVLVFGGERGLRFCWCVVAAFILSSLLLLVLLLLLLLLLSSDWLGI